MRPAQDPVEEFLSRISTYVESEGARNLHKISLDLDIPYQTARFRVNRLKEHGISISPFVDVESLGLARFRAEIELSDRVKDVNTFFGGLHQGAGLHYFARSLVSHKFDTEFLIPQGKGGELRRLLASLKELSLIENFSIQEIEWKDILMMKTEHYDYVNGQWDVDFSSLKANVAPDITPKKERMNSQFDHTDLLIIKSLQIDSQVKSVELAKIVERSDRDIAYHLNLHVFGRKLIPSFRLEWIGTKDAWAKHTVLMINYVFKKIDDDMLRHAISVFTSVPFTWNHLRTQDGGYFVELVIPVGYLPDTMKYLSENLRRLKIRPDEVVYPDWSCSWNYTIPYFLHDDSKGWKFDAEKNLELTLQTIQLQEH